MVGLSLCLVGGSTRRIAQSRRVGIREARTLAKFVERVLLLLLLKLLGLSLLLRMAIGLMRSLGIGARLSG